MIDDLIIRLNKLVLAEPMLEYSNCKGRIPACIRIITEIETTSLIKKLMSNEDKNDDFDFIVEGDLFLNKIINEIKQVICHQKGF